jgi:hypothetical protein
MYPERQYDPARAFAAHRAQERAAWDRYAASALQFADNNADECAKLSARFADALMAERRKRFPGPKMPEETL